MDNPLTTPDPGLYVWTIVTFIVLMILLRKIAWGPIQAGLDERRKTIAAAVEDARKAKEELERVKQDAAKLLAEARVEAHAVVSRSRADAERFAQEQREKAAAQAATIVKDAERRIQQEAARAVTELRTEAVELSFAIASKLLKRNVSKTDNEVFIQDVVKELEQPKN